MFIVHDDLTISVFQFFLLLLNVFMLVVLFFLQFNIITLSGGRQNSYSSYTTMKKLNKHPTRVYVLIIVTCLYVTISRIISVAPMPTIWKLNWIRLKKKNHIYINESKYIDRMSNICVFLTSIKNIHHNLLFNFFF